MSKHLFTMYVVYCNPTDYPGKYVVRRRTLDLADKSKPPEVDREPTIVCDTLREAAEAVPEFIPNQGVKHFIEREPDDEAQIVGVFV